MDTLSLLTAVPAVIGILIGLYTGGVTARKLFVAAARITYQLAGSFMNNADKRTAAIAQIYATHPSMALWVPSPIVGKIVDMAWEQVIKPLATAPQP